MMSKPYLKSPLFATSIFIYSEAGGVFWVPYRFKSPALTEEKLKIVNYGYCKRILKMVTKNFLLASLNFRIQLYFYIKLQ